jgi:dihydrodipicolinate synthase/N-acetylneuraminate lyase
VGFLSSGRHRTDLHDVYEQPPAESTGRRRFPREIPKVGSAAITDGPLSAHPFDLIRPRRRITGMSAILLPFRDGAIDWPAWEAHVERTVEAGLTPAVNMDTGFVQLLDPPQRTEVLARTSSLLRGNGSGNGTDFVAGAFVADEPGAPLDVDGYLRSADAVAAAGGTPIVFPSNGSAGRELELYTAIGGRIDRFLGFELGPMFVPYGRIFDLDTYTEMLRTIPSLTGAKHSSLSREAEWERLRVRDEVRPDFLVLTGNDLAVDMVMYGSDYLLGISTFAPDLFAQRDALWEKGDAAFYELNDKLQLLGSFAFRDPVPAYRHDAALFLELRGWVGPDAAHPRAPRRAHEDAEREILRTIATGLGVLG